LSERIRHKQQCGTAEDHIFPHRDVEREVIWRKGVEDKGKEDPTFGDAALPHGCDRIGTACREEEHLNRAVQGNCCIEIMEQKHAKINNALDEDRMPEGMMVGVGLDAENLLHLPDAVGRQAARIAAEVEIEQICESDHEKETQKTSAARDAERIFSKIKSFRFIGREETANILCIHTTKPLMASSRAMRYSCAAFCTNS